MIRFIDLTDFYWVISREEAKELDEKDGRGSEGVSPCCAFLNTITDRFLEFEGGHVIDMEEDLPNTPTGQRCRALIPEGFWKGGGT